MYWSHPYGWLTDLMSLVCHLVNTHCHRQDEHIILTRLDRHPITVTQAEPLLRYLRHLVPPLTNTVLVVKDVPLHFQVWPVLHLHHPPLTDRRDQRLLYRGDGLSMWSFYLHAVLDPQHLLLDLRQLVPMCILKDQSL